MKTKIKLGAKGELLLAFMLNALFLFVLLLFFEPYFETNDDFAMRHLCDGVYGFNEHRTLFINIVLGWVMKLLYTWLPSFAWYGLLQYFGMFLSFSAISWVLIRRAKIFPGMIMSLALLCIFGIDAYVCMQFTKTAAILSVSGLVLMFQALEEQPGRRHRILAMGMMLSLFGLMYRAGLFYVIGAIICFIILDMLLPKLCYKGLNAKLAGVYEILKPFLALLLLSGILVGLDRMAYLQEEWAYYREYNETRADVMDLYGSPLYDMALADTDAAGLSENTIQLIMSWNIFDPDVLDKGSFERLAELYEARRPTPERNFASRVFDCFSNIAHLWASLGLAAAALAWLLFGRHDKVALLAVGFSVSVFVLQQLYLVFIGRPGMYRVDYGLILALAVLVLWFIPRHAETKSAIAAALSMLLLTALIMSIYLPGWSAKFAKVTGADDCAMTSQVELLSGSDKLYIAEASFKDCYIYESPFAREPIAAAKNIFYLGGWQAMHPSIRASLAEYGVKNPYRDCVDNDGVRIVSQNIDLILEHIKQEYSPTARAVEVSGTTEEFAYGVYKIVS